MMDEEASENTMRSSTNTPIHGPKFPQMSDQEEAKVIEERVGLKWGHLSGMVVFLVPNICEPKFSITWMSKLKFNILQDELDKMC